MFFFFRLLSLSHFNRRNWDVAVGFFSSSLVSTVVSTFVFIATGYYLPITCYSAVWFISDVPVDISTLDGESQTFVSRSLSNWLSVVHCSDIYERIIIMWNPFNELVWTWCDVMRMNFETCGFPNHRFCHRNAQLRFFHKFQFIWRRKCASNHTDNSPCLCHGITPNYYKSDFLSLNI